MAAAEAEMRQRLEPDIRQQLEREFAERLARLEREYRRWASAGVDISLVRQMKAMQHPDKVQHPEAKAQMHEAFIAFEEATKPRVETAAARAKRQAEWEKARAATRQKRSQRSKEAWARRKAQG